jgi:BON domain-containing protein
MPKHENLRPKPVPIALGCLFAALTLAACDHPSTRALSVPPVTGSNPRSITVAQASAIEAPAPQATAPKPIPAAETLTDTVITGKVKASLVTDPGMTGADVSVNTDRGVVHLTGTVKSQEQAAIASAHAQRQDGVMRIDSHLSVNPS